MVRYLQTEELQQVMIRRLQMKGLRKPMVHRPNRTRVRKRVTTRLDITGLRKATVRRLVTAEGLSNEEANRLLKRFGLGSARIPGLAYPFARYRRLYRRPRLSDRRRGPG